MPANIIVKAAVEGIVDEAVVRRLLCDAQAIPGEVYGKNGKAHLRQRLRGYNNAARHAPWIVLVDLGRDADCAPPLRSAWLPDPAPHMFFRVAVRAVEAWLLADRHGMASFLKVRRQSIPADPEKLEDPKGVIVDLARQSRRREIREDMIPRPGSGRRVGPAYSSRVIEFASTFWRPETALECCDSLKRTVEGLRRLVDEWSSSRA
jgi:hypothetical protein